MLAEFNDEMWPIVVITYYNVSDKDFKEKFKEYQVNFLNLIKKLKINNQKGIILYDFNKVGTPNLIQGMKNKKFKDSIEHLIEENVLLTYMIAKNGTFRNTIKMIAASEIKEKQRRQKKLNQEVCDGSKLLFGKTVDAVLQTLYSQTKEAVAV
jgi:hemerythrin-like domain-containing protein